MKKQIIFLVLTLIISSGVFAQSSNTFTQDEIARINFSIHLITYDTINSFDNAAGEAYYTIVLNSFKENLSIPQLTSSTITANDKAKTEKLIQQFNQITQNPPTWNDLFTKQTQYLIWLDKALRKRSKYKN